MTIKRKACVTGIYEHPTRKATDKSLAQLHAEVAQGALADAGLDRKDVDGYFCAEHRSPRFLRSDSGPEFVSHAILE